MNGIEIDRGVIEKAVKEYVQESRQQEERIY